MIDACHGAVVPIENTFILLNRGLYMRGPKRDDDYLIESFIVDKSLINKELIGALSLASWCSSDK